ncbi:PP0621 family protein [Massilia agri]|uniref:PP0621 family protein n=1 Tax=Massilia agri TaxID=1886785 RepID=A0ABT2AHT6_9BURK|nr:PP0621 family protein [Massilia agri]MCS0595761.1 PP0621 family protein [Massilia agri]
MTRILFWIALIVLVVLAVRAKLKALSRQQSPFDQPRQQQRPQEPVREIESMTQCAHCGLHFPASEAVHADGHDYCSPGHVRLPPK